MTAGVSRRAVLGTGAAALAAGLSACDDVPLDQTRPGALRSPDAAPTPVEDPDEDLLQAALQLEATQVARLDRVLSLRLAGPARERLTGARTVHLAHLDLLRGEDPRPVVEPPTTTAGRLLDRVAATELAIAEQHASAALAAESGGFARVLASMAASARQQATLLQGLPRGAGA